MTAKVLQIKDIKFTRWDIDQAFLSQPIPLIDQVGLCDECMRDLHDLAAAAKIVHGACIVQVEASGRARVMFLPPEDAAALQTALRPIRARAVRYGAEVDLPDEWLSDPEAGGAR